MCRNGGSADMSDKGRISEIFSAFLKLGLTSFGGPIAHLGYFREEFVVKRNWIDETRYASLISLCQFLPGPASSQVGFALGLIRGGWRGGCAAFLAFTAPSVVLMIGFALIATSFQSPVMMAALAGLKLAAAAIIIQAVLGMSHTLCARTEQALIAVMSMAIMAVLPVQSAMVTAIIAGGLLGRLILTAEMPSEMPPHLSVATVPIPGFVSVFCLILFVMLFIGLAVLASVSDLIEFISRFYHAGALVFGGGHVVLPLLEAGFVRPDEMISQGTVSADRFLAGYGAAQALPGPLFSFAGYLGAASASGTNAVLMGLTGVGAIFLPGFLLLISCLSFWERVQRSASVTTALAGINASVVGILGYALYDPVLISSVHSGAELVVVVFGVILLVKARLSPLWVALVCASSGIMLAFIPFI